MTWKFVGDKKGLEPLPGLPLASSDIEWKDAMAVYEANASEPGAGKAVEASGLYQHTNDKAPATPAEG